MKKILIVLTLSCLLTVPAFAAEAAKSLVQVSGSSQQEINPDIARLTLTIKTVNTDLEAAKRENTKNSNQLLAKLKALGLTDAQIKTATYHVEPVYSYEKDRLPKLKGYNITNSLEITSPIEKTGLLVSEATAAGANEIGSIRFEAANENDAKDAALKEAMADALRKAKVIASALNKRVSNVTQVNESGVYYRPLMLESRAAKAEDAAGPVIPAGKVTVSANVQMTVELE
ncbi:SIMPL domain-containing protein [Acetonema longum]|uniref:Outer membrane protein n=1 Tax=Acetonema longum DSM 6540 TaxID=1009370 RepID=F7NFT9_9FIRM|nr:SIMPL domain-containing protein [Acetonema longum]EGO65100.1 outer membrane protein [Acetonema longum DSM 6540]